MYRGSSCDFFQVGGGGCGDGLLVASHGVVDGVGELSFEAAEGFLGGLSFGDLALVVDAAGGISGSSQSRV